MLKIWKKSYRQHAYYSLPCSVLTLIIQGGERNYHPLSENRDFSGTEPTLDLRPVCKFKFVRCGPGEKTRALYLSRLKRGGPMKFENTFFQIAKLTIFNGFRQNSKFSKNFQGKSLKVRGLIFWILAFYIRI